MQRRILLAESFNAVSGAHAPMCSVVVACSTHAVKVATNVCTYTCHVLLLLPGLLATATHIESP